MMPTMNEVNKNRNKLQQVNIVSKLCFIYVLKLFKTGFKRTLTIQDLSEVLPNLSAEQLKKKLHQKQFSSVIDLLWKIFAIDFFTIGFGELLIGTTIGIILQPYLLAKIISYFTPGQEELSQQDASIYTFSLICVLFLGHVATSNFKLYIETISIKIRSVLYSFIYEKLFSSASEISEGNVLTLVTRDVQIVQEFVRFGNFSWVTIVQLLVATGALFFKLGVAGFVGISCFVLFMPLQIFLGGKVTNLTFKMCDKTDKRVEAIQEAVSAIRTVKMYTWEEFFCGRISTARRMETNAELKAYLLRFMILALGLLNSQISLYLTNAAYVKFGNYLSSDTLYYIYTIYLHLTYITSIEFPTAVFQTGEFLSAIRRINEFVGEKIEKSQPQNNTTSQNCIILDNVSVMIKNHKILEKLNLLFVPGLTIITGPTGSGKTILVKTIMDNFTIQGKISASDDISYASQEPWLFPSTLKNNILFDQTYDDQRYQEVLRICSLVLDLQQLEYGDATIIEDRGANLSKGQQARVNLARAIYKNSDIYILDDCLASLDANVSSFIFKECIQKFLKDKIVLLVSTNHKFLPQADGVVLVENGTASFTKSVEYSTENQENTDQKDNLDSTTKEEIEVSVEEETQLLEKKKRDLYQEEQKEGDVDLKTYYKYYKSGGGFPYFAFLLIVFISTQGLITYKDKFLSDWANYEEEITQKMKKNVTNISEDLEDERTHIIIIYSVLTLGIAIASFLTGFAVLLCSRKASLKIHQQMVENILHGVVKFFDSTFLGNILNRFSKDIAAVDESIPFTLYETFWGFGEVTGVVVLVSVVNPIFLVPTGIFLICVALLRTCYLRTSTSLKRLDTITRSPVVGHINATLNGLITIKAFKAESLLKKEFSNHQDLYSSASYMFAVSSQAFIFFLDTLSSIFESVVIIRLLLLNDVSSGGVGLAITQAYLLGGVLNYLVAALTNLENSMTSVERCIEYTEINREEFTNLDLKDWPQRGEITFSNVFLSYTNSKNFVLKNVNFSVKGGEKIGIVGRTGAGKTSIISSLFRLYNIEGKILIDGEDISTLALDFLRSKLSIIPQDPVIFAGSIRENIDPLGHCKDEEIWKALNKTKLKVSDLGVEASSLNLSLGQKQLLCLARAIVRKNKIIVFDEATGAMDHQTEKMIYEIIAEVFRNCSVIAIVHQLEFILSFDRIVVMDKGEVVECGSTRSLLEKEGGYFRQMVDKAGVQWDK